MILGRMRHALFLFATLGSLSVGVGSLDTDTVERSPDGEQRDEIQGGTRNAFTEAETCALCHSASENANALWSPTGDDVSPHGTWQATMMANSFRDPYWRAQVRKEVLAAPTEEKAEEIEALCITCHGPAAHHTALLAGKESLGVFGSAKDSLALDGVTCTVCHQATPDGLGEESSFSGGLVIRDERKIYGPYEDPSGRPMLMHTGYEATHGGHMSESALCGSCHTLYTHHIQDGPRFPEQTPYLEWRNSDFSTEASVADAAENEGLRPTNCQECHMPDQGPMRIARNPAGRDFNIPIRNPFRSHGFVGGNAYMLDILRENREELGVKATPEALARSARATRRNLAHNAADLEVIDLAVGEDGKATFDVVVTNKTGHKLPTGYPARRAWLRVQVRSGRTQLFESGGFDERGELEAARGRDAFDQPHHDRITDSSQVQIYEMVADDDSGEPTSYLTRMASRRKDNRLLPAGWSVDGPHAGDTAPVGVGDDRDFVGGQDRVRFEVDLPEGTSPQDVVVVAWLLYQPVPPHWIEPLRGLEAPEPERFVRMADAAQARPETLAVTVGLIR
ncbi:MAG: multiheme c-type cytochrome [Planctomycetota bacterium]